MIRRRNIAVAASTLLAAVAAAVPATVATTLHRMPDHDAAPHSIAPHRGVMNASSEEPYCC